MSKKEFWSQYADNFEKLNNYVVGIKDMQIVKNELINIKNLGKVLELACGNGAYTNVIINNAKSIVATDISKDMVKASKIRFKDYKNIKVEKADSLNLVYKDESFDTVFLANLLHIVSDYEKVVEEVYRVLKPNGKIVVLDFTTFGMSFLNIIKIKYRFLKTYGKPTNKAKKQKFSPKDMRDLLVSKHFDIFKEKLLGDKTKAVFTIAIKT